MNMISLLVLANRIVIVITTGMVTLYYTANCKTWNMEWNGTEWNGMERNRTIYKMFNISQINSELITYIHACMHKGATYVHASYILNVPCK